MIETYGDRWAAALSVLRGKPTMYRVSVELRKRTWRDDPQGVDPICEALCTIDGVRMQSCDINVHLDDQMIRFGAR